MTDPNRKKQDIIALFQTHYEFIVGVAYRFAPKPDLIYDIAQQTFVRFVEYAEKKEWNLDEEIKPLIFTMTKSVAFDLWRRYRLENGKAMVLIGEKLKHIQAEKMRETHEEEKIAEEIEALRQCKKKLQPKHLEILEEHYNKGVSIKEIARERQLNLSTLRKFFFRLRGKLKDCIRQTLLVKKDGPHE